MMRWLQARSLAAVLFFALAGHAAAEPYKVLHVSSNRADWAWVQEQQKGFLEGLGNAQATVRLIDLDAQHNNPAQLKAAVAKAHELIESWKPDLIYTTDDVAQAEVAVRYAGKGTPIVYSGVNKEHADYGYDKVKNVTGVLEREHFAGTLTLLRSIRPTPKLRLAIVFDDGPTWEGVEQRIRAELARRSDVEVTHWLRPKTFDEFKSTMQGLQDKVDAVGLLGIFRFSQADGKYADYETVLRWVVDNSRLPDFSFWDSRVERGTLCAMAVSGIEQGRQAGRIARRILIDKVPPASIVPEPTAKGRPMISLARARKLGLQINASVLLNAEVLTRYAWEPQ